MAGHAEASQGLVSDDRSGQMFTLPTSTPRYVRPGQPAFWAEVSPVFLSLYATRWACQRPPGRRRGGLGRARRLAVPRHRPAASDVREQARRWPGCFLVTAAYPLG